MTEDIVNHQIKELKKLMDSGELHVRDIDVFCEKGKSNRAAERFEERDLTVGVYTTEQSRRILTAGKEIGLSVNFHGDELNYTGSAEVRRFVLKSNFFFERFRRWAQRSAHERSVTSNVSPKKEFAPWPHRKPLP